MMKYLTAQLKEIQLKAQSSHSSRQRKIVKRFDNYPLQEIKRKVIVGRKNQLIRMMRKRNINLSL